ncbi:MAG TPA: LysM peptidoglycan-binding domain-containing protein [Methylomirabilota bacterium]|nr:LysM peptidoglycan-binding domain-containing protein [Methylomirabilota bacterium]
MKYIKPHLSPELRAQIIPHKRRDIKLTVVGVIFSLLSILLIINLWPSTSQAPLINNKPVENFTQSDNLTTLTGKQVLGAATEEPVDTTPAPATTPDSSDFTQYTVKAGDTLFNISQQYNIRWDLIAQVNNLSEPYVLHAGQELKIPQTTTSQIPDKIYTIKAGDTLSSIAKQFNITTSDIIAVNPNLQKSDLITVGQVIKLP